MKATSLLPLLLLFSWVVAESSEAVKSQKAQLERDIKSWAVTENNVNSWWERYHTLAPALTEEEKVKLTSSINRRLKEQLEKEVKSWNLTEENMHLWWARYYALAPSLSEGDRKKLEKKLRGRQRTLAYWTQMYESWYRQCDYKLGGLTESEIREQFRAWVRYEWDHYPSIAQKTLDEVARGEGFCSCPPYPQLTWTERLSRVTNVIAAGFQASADAYGKAANAYVTRATAVQEYYGLRVGLNGRVYDENGVYVGSVSRIDGLHGRVGVKENGKIYDQDGNYLGKLRSY